MSREETQVQTNSDKFKPEDLVFSYKEGQKKGEVARIDRYVDVAFYDIKVFFERILGGVYEKKNNFNFNQKQNILKAVYAKNMYMNEKTIKMQESDYLDDIMVL